MVRLPVGARAATPAPIDSALKLQPNLDARDHCEFIVSGVTHN